MSQIIKELRDETTTLDFEIASLDAEIESGVNIQGLLLSKKQAMDRLKEVKSLLQKALAMSETTPNMSASVSK